MDADELIEPPDPERRAELLLDLGEARNTTGDAVGGRDDFVAAAELARRCDRPDLLGRAAYGYGGDAAVWLDFGDPVGPALLDEALVALPVEPSVTRALCLAQRSLWHLLDADGSERRRLAEAAATMADAAGDAAAYEYTLGCLAQALVATGEVDALRALMDDYVVLAEEADDDYHRSQAQYFDIQAQYFANDVDGVRSALADMQAVDPRRLTALQRWSLVCIASNLAILDGRWADVVEPDPEDTSAVGITGGSVPLNHRFRALHLQGETDAALEALSTMVRDHWVSVSVWPNDAWTSWAMGDLLSAATQLEAWHRDVFPAHPRGLPSTRHRLHRPDRRRRRRTLAPRRLHGRAPAPARPMGVLEPGGRRQAGRPRARSPGPGLRRRRAR